MYAVATSVLKAILPQQPYGTLLDYPACYFSSDMVFYSYCGEARITDKKLVAGGGGGGSGGGCCCADCGGGGDGHLYVAVVLVVAVKLDRVRTWNQVKGFCTDAIRLTMKAISQGYCIITGLTECIRFNNLKKKNPTLHYPFSRPDMGVYFRGLY